MAAVTTPPRPMTARAPFNSMTLYVPLTARLVPFQSTGFDTMTLEPTPMDAGAAGAPPFLIQRTSGSGLPVGLPTAT